MLDSSMTMDHGFCGHRRDETAQGIAKEDFARCT